MVNFDLNELLALFALGEGEGNGDVREILGEFSCKLPSLADFVSFHSQLRSVKCSSLPYLVGPQR